MTKTRTAAPLVCRDCGQQIAPEQKRVYTAAGPKHEPCYEAHQAKMNDWYLRVMNGYDRAGAIGTTDAIFFHKQRHSMGSGILFIDTETTGRPDMTKLPEQQPRIVQLAAMLTEEGATTRAQFSTLIRPDGWTIPQEAQDIHGLSLDDCQCYGIPIFVALAALTRLAECAKLIVAHNSEFDVLIVRGEYARLGLPLLNRPDNELPTFCTMKAATDTLRLPGRRPGTFKWPSLAETHRHFFKTDFEGAHDAMADVLACAKCFFAMNKEKSHVATNG